MEDVSANFAYEILGGLEGARSKFGDRFACGKLGIVKVEGKPARLV